MTNPDYKSEGDYLSKDIERVEENLPPTNHNLIYPKIALNKVVWTECVSVTLGKTSELTLRKPFGAFKKGNCPCQLRCRTMEDNQAGNEYSLPKSLPIQIIN